MSWRAAFTALPATAVCLALIAWASAAPVRHDSGGTARLRLSWSARPERIEQCRELTAEELAARGEHMRQRLECTGHFASYDLQVEIDDQVVHRSVAQGGGLRNDRPIFLVKDLVISPGNHRVRVTFNRRGEDADDDDHGDDVDDDDDREHDGASGISAVREDRERIERARRSRAAIPRRLSLDTTITLTEGRVAIVTLDPETRALKLLSQAH